MKLEFCKMQGAGNDFVVIDNRIARLTPEQMPLLARKVCARRTSSVRKAPVHSSCIREPSAGRSKARRRAGFQAW